jgi:hypothetical protein
VCAGGKEPGAVSGGWWMRRGRPAFSHHSFTILAMKKWSVTPALQRHSIVALAHQVRDVRPPMLHDHLAQNLERWLDVTIDLSMVAIRNGSMNTSLTGLT